MIDALIVVLTIVLGLYVIEKGLDIYDRMKYRVMFFFNPQLQPMTLNSYSDINLPKTTKKNTTKRKKK